MKALMLVNYELTFLNCIVLVLFLAIFTGMLLWISRKSSRKLYAHMKQFPLNH